MHKLLLTACTLLPLLAIGCDVPVDDHDADRSFEIDTEEEALLDECLQFASVSADLATNAESETEDTPAPANAFSVPVDPSTATATDPFGQTIPPLWQRNFCHDLCWDLRSFVKSNCEHLVETGELSPWTNCEDQASSAYYDCMDGCYGD